MQPGLRHLLVVAGLTAGCGRPDHVEQQSDSAARATADSQLRLDASATCLVANRSVLARAPNTAAPGPANLRGWIALDQLSLRDSGTAKLVDSDGFALDGSWRTQNDSIVIQGLNDFVRIDMRLRLADSAARGSLMASSDAALERDSAGKLREFHRSASINLVRVDCGQMPKPAGGAAIDVLPHGIPRPGIRFDPSSIRKGTSVGALVLDSIVTRQALAADSSYVGQAYFRGEIELKGWTLRHPDADASRLLTCFEADSSSAARLPRWTGDERRAWFCFSNRAEAARALGPPSEGVPATIVIDRFTIHRGMSDEVNSARFVRLKSRG